MAQRTPSETPFEDYYYILNVPLDGSGGEIERAYWQLVGGNGSAAASLDEANEAYRVLTSPQLRREYDQLRDAVLGKSAPPQPPQREQRRTRPPLVVMEKQRPRPRPETNPARQGRRLVRVGWWWRALVLVAVLTALMLITVRVA